MSPDNWVEKIKQSARHETLDRAAEQFDFNCSLIKEVCKSPIERALAYAMAAADWGHLQDVLPAKFIEAEDEGFSAPSDRISFAETAVIWPQMPIGRYTVDFGVLSIGIKIAVECDGHNFHERTKEQAAHDRLRDRYIQSQGWLVARFTGSEIYKDAKGCVSQVMTMAWSEFLRRQDYLRAS